MGIPNTELPHSHDHLNI